MVMTTDPYLPGDWYRAVLAKSADAIALVEREGRILFVTAPIQRLTGYAPHELIGTSAFDLIHRDDMPRVREAFRRAAESRVAIGDIAGEGRSQSNLADTLQKLGRLDEARCAIRRAIECKAPFGHAARPWRSWAILANIEADDGNASAATEARAKAVACYLAYRGDGGENHDADGRISLAVTEKLLAGDAAGAVSLLDELSSHPDLPAWLRRVVTALQSIAAGSRDRRLADVPEFHPTTAAELLHLLDLLDAHERGRSGR